MSDHTHSRRWDSIGEEPTGSNADIETYEDEGNVIFFDAQNPLAWLEASRTVRLEELA